MLKIAKKIVKFKVPILIISVLLLIPATLGFLNTRINYDILSYLPSDIDTMEGQEILKNDFGTGGRNELPDKIKIKLRKIIYPEQSKEEIESICSSINNSINPSPDLIDAVYSKKFHLTFFLFTKMG